MRNQPGGVRSTTVRWGRTVWITYQHSTLSAFTDFVARYAQYESQRRRASIVELLE